MLDVDDILSSPVAPLVLAPPVAEPVCEIAQRLPLFEIAQASLQPQSVDAVTYEWMNSLPSLATSFSCSGELPLFIGSGPNSPTAIAGTLSSSQQLQLERQQPTQQLSQQLT